MAVRRLTVSADAPPRLDAFLLKAIPGSTKQQVAGWLSQGKVKVNGKKARPLRRIVGGEIVEVEVPDVKAPSPNVKVEGPKLHALYEDQDLIIIDKPANLVVEPEDDRVSAVELVAHQFRGFDVAGLHQPGVVHRIDKDTTGCLMFAKTDEAMHGLNRAFDEKRIKKTYLGLVLGSPDDVGKLDTSYGRNPEDPRRFTSRVSSPRRARLSWVKKQQFDGFALIEIDLDTGRTHQIRAQMSDIGHPLLGDWLYGTAEAKERSIGRIALHAWKLDVNLEQEPVHVEAPIPADFQRGMGPRP